MSIVENTRRVLEKKGEYVIRANLPNSWFAAVPQKLEKCREVGSSIGRSDINLLIYRTKSSDERDHYVIPFSAVADLFVKESLTHSKANGSIRWNCTIENGLLHVSHTGKHTDVSKFHRGQLVTETTPLNQLLTEEVFGDEVFSEGSVVRVTVNRYERDADARRRCIKLFGPVCAICNLNFGAVYGSGMEGFIHVHHIRPLHEIGKDYVVNPKTDLIPVCPNCHAVIHSARPALTTDEVRKLIQKQKQ